MFPIACYQATGQHFAHSAPNDRFPAILNAQNPAIPSAHPQLLGEAVISKIEILDDAGDCEAIFGVRSPCFALVLW